MYTQRSRSDHEKHFNWDFSIKRAWRGCVPFKVLADLWVAKQMEMEISGFGWKRENSSLKTLQQHRSLLTTEMGEVSATHSNPQSGLFLKRATTEGLHFTIQFSLTLWPTPAKKCNVTIFWSFLFKKSKCADITLKKNKSACWLCSGNGYRVSYDNQRCFFSIRMHAKILTEWKS